MPAVINTAAKFWQQNEVSIDTSSATPLAATITGVLTGGSRVNVTIENPAQAPQTPSSAWRERNIPFVETGVAPPATGHFVTATDYAPPVEDGGSGS